MPKRSPKAQSASAPSPASGLWLMAEDRVRTLHTRMREMAGRGGAVTLRGANDQADDTDVCPVEYSVRDGVATIHVVGILTKYPMPEPWMDEWCGTVPALGVLAALDKAMADWTVKSVVFVIDSPGGMVAGTSELADAIAAYKTTHPDKLIHAVVSDLAASGGYYIASQCRTIACNPMGETGCIGVYCVLVDDSKFYEDLGVTFTVVSSGGVKGLGADGKVSQELIDDQKRGVMAMYEKFIADVAKGRGISLEQARQLGDGRTWIAPEALKLGLIDTVASVGDATAAISKETSRMNAEAFKAYAAEHPDAVTGFIEQGYNQAKSDLSPKAATVAQLEEAFPGQDAFVLAQLKAGATLADANAAAVKAMRADLAAAEQKHGEAVAAKDKEISDLKAENDRLKFEASGQKPISTAGGKKEDAQASADPADFEKIEDPKARAKAEYAADFNGCKNDFTNEAAYVGFRVADLSGRIKTKARRPQQ